MSDSTVYIKGMSSITKSDSTNLSAFNYRAIYVGTSGDVSITDKFGNTSVLPNLVAGIWHPIGEYVRVNSTGTTAQNIFGGW